MKVFLGIMGFVIGKPEKGTMMNYRHRPLHQLLKDSVGRSFGRGWGGIINSIPILPKNITQLQLDHGSVEGFG